MSIQTASVLLTPSQISTLSTNPIQIIAAQGANTYITLLEASFNLQYNSTPYVGSDFIRFVCNDQLLQLFEAKYIMTKTMSSVQNSSSVNLASIPLSTVANQPVMLTSTANYTGGDSNVLVTVLYFTVTGA